MKNKCLLLTAALAVFILTALSRADTSLDEAQAALKANNLAQAEALLAPLTGPDTHDAAACHTFSQVRLAQKNSLAAIELAEHATKLDATKAEYFCQLGRSLAQRIGEVSFNTQGMLAMKLKQSFEKCVELDPHNVGGLIGLSRYYTNAPEIAGGSLGKAQTFALRLTTIVPFLGEIEQGYIAQHSENYPEALTHFEAAAKMNPNYAESQSQCGQMLLKLKRNDEARARFTVALKLNPTLESAKIALAALEAKKI